MSEGDFHIMLIQKAALTRSLGITSLILQEYETGDRDRACRAAEMLSRIVLETGSVGHTSPAQGQRLAQSSV